jgi:hypothetical protein
MGFKGELTMQNRQTLLLVIIALLLGINAGYLLRGNSGAGLNVLPTASAGTPIMTSRGDEIFTCSDDGPRLYRWTPKSSGANDLNPWVASEYTK